MKIIYRSIPITGYAPTSGLGHPSIFQANTNNYTFEKDSLSVPCNNCSLELFTRVERKVSSNGMAWALLCCFCGSWLLSLLVLCVDGFREFHHYCSACNSLLGMYRPTFSGGMVFFLVLVFQMFFSC